MKLFFFSLLLLTAFAFAGNAERRCTVYSPCKDSNEANAASEQTSPSPGHWAYQNGFYLDIGVGGAYTSFHGSKNATVGGKKCSIRPDGSYGCTGEEASTETQVRDFSGFGPAFNIKAGGMFKSTLAFYANLDFVVGIGDCRDDVLHECSSNKAVRILLGPGVMLYPVHSDNSSLRGLFVGGDVGIAIGGAGSAIPDFGIGAKVEAGKTWQIAERTSVGGFAFFSIDDPLSEAGVTPTIFSIGLGLKIINW